LAIDLPKNLLLVVTSIHVKYGEILTSSIVRRARFGLW